LVVGGVPESIDSTSPVFSTARRYESFL
jgi:hypothetical protein